MPPPAVIPATALDAAFATHTAQAVSAASQVDDIDTRAGEPSKVDVDAALRELFAA
jgi:hypothetical protein